MEIQTKQVNKMITKQYNSVLEIKNNISESATLIAVSKKQSVDKIMELYNVGCRDFGENKVQELMDKIPNLPKDINWHMIGHLQTNKVKYIIDKVSLIHSVDSVKLAREINKQSAKKNIIMDILIEINVAREESKYGFKVEEVRDALIEISKFENVRVKGFMTIAPYVENSNNNREIFRELKQLLVDITEEKLDNIDISMLSMGMSNDFLVALEEGATYIRVGSLIFE